MTTDVVILTRNRPQCCAKTLRTVAEAWPPGCDGRIWIVNNGGTPPPVPDRLGDRACRLVSLPRNVGAQARNRVIFQYPPADILLMLDDDARLTRRAFEDMLRLFAADPQAGAVAFRVMNGAHEEGCLLPTVFHGCACAFRACALREVGGYPSGYLYYGEEYEIAFRLYAVGWRIALADTLGQVVHERDQAGRDTARILQMLIHNNASLWASVLPRTAIRSALKDTLYRYRLVARKEKANSGFLRGCLSLPLALAHGWARRRPLPEPVFRKIALLDPLVQLGRQLRAAGVRRATLCGIGKFPGLWRSALCAEGLDIREFWDSNACWTGRSLYDRKVRVLNHESDAFLAPPPSEGHAFIVGLASMGENVAWHEHLLALGKKTIPPDERPEFFSFSGTNDLLRLPVRAYM